MSWPVVKLGDVVNFIGGSQPPKSEFIYEPSDGYVRLLQIRDYKSDANKTYIPEVSTKKFCDASDVMIGRYGPPVFQILRGLEGAYNVALMKAVPSEKVDKEYLYYFLKQERLFRLIDGLSQRTAGQSGIDMDALKSYPMLLPPLKEQKRIAAILDKADGMRRKRQQAIELADEFLRSVFLDMFGDPVTNPRGLKSTTIGELCDVGTGATPSRKVDEYYNGDIPWVKTTEVDGYVIHYTEESISVQGLENSSCKLNPTGSIVLAMYGQGKTRGKVGVLGIEAATNQACAVLRPSSKVMMEYLYVYLSMSYDVLRSLGQGGGQPNLNLSIVKNFPVLLPSKSDQIKFVEVSDSVKGIKQKNVITVQESDVFFQSLSQKAFSGEL